MMGGRRLVRIEAASDIIVPAVKLFLEDSPGDGVIVISAGDLPPRSGLRKMVETAKNAVVLPCYLDDARALEGLVREVMQENGLRIEPEAMSWVLTQLGSDRAISRSELEKLALYKGPVPPGGDPQIVTLADAQACVGDSGTLTLETIAIATSGGDLRQLDDALFKAFTRGENPVAVLRAVSRRLQRIQLVVGEMAQGAPIEQALKGLRPPVFFKEVPAFKAHVNRWSTTQLSRAMDILIGAEIDCKTTGLPAESICARACLRIANAARR